MRTNATNLRGRLHQSFTVFATAGLLCMAVPSALSQIVPASPVGTWDCVVSGTQQGIAYLTFGSDFTISGFELLTYQLAQVPTVDPRNPSGGDTGRGGITTTNTSNTSTNGGSSTNSPSTNTAPVAVVTYILGFGPISGLWSYNAQGKTVGYFTEGAGLGSESRSPSFVATVKPGKRMSLRAIDSPNPNLLGAPPRNCLFTGVPYSLGPDLDGSWMGNGVANSSVTITPGGRFTEFFTLTNLSSLAYNDGSFLLNFPYFWPLTNSPGISNSYFYLGSGPGYTNFGLAVVSVQKKLAIVTEDVPTGTFGSVTNSVLRSEAGAYYPLKSMGNLNGIDENSTKVNIKVSRSLY